MTALSVSLAIPSVRATVHALLRPSQQVALVRVVPLRRCSIGVYALLLHGLVAAARALGNRLAELLLEVVLDVVVVPVVLPELVGARRGGSGARGEGIGDCACLFGCEAVGVSACSEGVGLGVWGKM